MRLLTAVLLLLLPGLAVAQSSRPSTAVTATARPAGPSEVPALAPIGLPLPPIGLPLPVIGLPPIQAPGSRAAAAPSGSRRPHAGGEKRRGRPGPSVIYVVPAYGYGWSTASVAAPEVPVAPPTADSSPRIAARQPTGTLRLDLQPRVNGQVFVDGVYVGTLDELGEELTLDAGTRHVELRQPGFETLTLPVRIDDGRAITYRGSLKPLATPPAATPLPPAPPPPAIARKPFYYIPGCYLGDVPPRDAKLPATCDPSLAVTFRP